ncbi:LysR family transcriptional regulator [Bordetella ansorpii]|nr:LysR family transcriptional regulator [Bordetella ansorpii]
MNFRLRQMEVFRAVMLTGSINGASKLLFISQPAVSRLVAHTEQTLGLKLFNRVKGKLVPTPESTALFREVEDFYQHALRVDAFSRNLAKGPSGMLRISASPSLSKGLLPRTITRFMKRYPDIRLHFHETLLADMAQEVLSNKVDLAVSVLPVEHANLEAEPFDEGRMVCVVPRGHELGQQRQVSFTDLARYPLIVHDPGIAFGQILAAACRKANVAIHPHVDIHQTDVACALVRAGAGIAMVDEYTVAGLAWADLQVLTLAEEIKLTPSVVRSRFDNGTSHAEKFVAVLREQSDSDRKAQGL